MRKLPLFLLMGVALLFAATTAPPPLIGPQAQSDHSTYVSATNDTSGGQKATTAPEVQPGATNAGALSARSLTYIALLSLLAIGAFAGLKRSQPSPEVAAGVGEACAG